MSKIGRNKKIAWFGWLHSRDLFEILERIKIVDKILLVLF
jgi:hypothetical protein